MVGIGVRFSASVIWTHYERPEICYKEYLGPDWKPSYENASSKVINHQAWVDSAVIMQWNCGAYIAKDAVRKLPFAGTVATLCGSLYINRSSNEDRAAMLKAIGERQKKCEQGLYPPLLIYPEGGTTNGSALIKFAKGAFQGLHSL